MRDLLKSSRRWLRAHWVWPLVLLALPTCGLPEGTEDPFADTPVHVFDPGAANTLTGAIMCDVPKPPADGVADPCADAAEMASGMSMAHAAVALVQGEKNLLGLALDFSSTATSACGGGVPGKTEFRGPYPDGLTVCLNCGTQIPTKYADALAVCVAKCTDLINFSEAPKPSEGAAAFCQANAKVSTNFPLTGCFANACTSAGAADSNFFDPRRNQELVTWVDPVDANPSGNSVTGTTGTVTGDFNSGASSDQRIKQGDGWVEFEASENTLSHVVGLSPDYSTPDLSPTLADVAFAISLNYDGNVNIIEGGNLVAGPVDQYVAGKRYRVRVKDNNNGTATITYTRLDGACTAGTICSETELGKQTAPSPSYPLRVVARFRDAKATLANVTLVRIIP